MSNEAKQLIEAFAALDAPDRYAVIVELARISQSDADMVSDEELTRAGAELFTMYDTEEETPSGNAETR